MNNNPLMDKEFLKLLDLDKHKEIYAKIVSLDINENPVEEILGKVSQGTVNIDGSSAVRRTCSLTILNNNVNINDYHWGLSTKFSLAIGLKIPDHIRKISKVVSYEKENTNAVLQFQKETIYPYLNFPEIVWFKQGVFLVTEFKITYATNNSNISISGKDKMCLLNGDIGGNFPSLTDLGVTEYTDENGDITQVDNTLKSIIREMIHYYGGEPFHNIIINDLDNKGIELLDFAGDNLYLFKNVKTGVYENAIIDGDVPRYDKLGNKVIVSQLKNYDNLSGSLIGTSNADLIKATKSMLDDTYYTVVNCSYGQAVGYRNTDLTYTGDLIANAGDTITSILDKITKMLGDYEYFYNIDGQFIFLKKLTYINTSWNNIVKIEDDEDYVESSKLVSLIAYNFSDSNLITSFSNNPNFTNIKNDYSIWGKRKNGDSSGKDNYIHLRCAIDNKPEEYTQIKVTESDLAKWIFNEPNFFEGMSEEGKQNFIQERPKTFSSSDYDWREILYQMAVDYLKYNHLDDFEIRLKNANPQFTNGHTGYEQYYTDIKEFWRYLYNPEVVNDSDYFCLGDEDTTEELRYWNRLVAVDPSSLRFWFDFIGDSNGALSKYSVAAIGDRPKVINDDDVRAIYYGEIPTIIYITKTEYDKLKEADLINDGYTYIILPETMEDYFTVSSKNKSAQDELDSLLFEYAYCNETISINAIPVYYLLPNTRIGVYDSIASINGEYIINKITLPLSYNGTMTISATKAPIRLY